MQTSAPPLALTGLTAKGRRLAAAMGFPGCVVADAGHPNGARMRDFGAFADPDSPRTAILVECGQHWAKSSVRVAIAACRQFLAALEIVARRDCSSASGAAPARRAAADGRGHRGGDRYRRRLSLRRRLPGLEVIPERGTVIAHDGARPIRTPYDDCVLIMPSRRLTPGLTAVRLGAVRRLMAVQVRAATAADAETIAAFAHALSLEEGYPAPALQADTCAQRGSGRARAFGR